ncbi:MAG: T9SS type A sorting domain-containing protein [Taibaiella sp.]|nr:T9SS type A sorting domain-containing protein [Taibaiella sp.]
MKKTFILIYILICNTAFSQKVIYTEDFDHYSGYNITHWQHQFTGCVPWFAGLAYQVTPCIGPLTSVFTDINKIAGVSDCTGFCRGSNKNVFMYSPTIYLTGDSDLWLRYDSYFARDTESHRTERATVEISTDGGTTFSVIQDVPANSSFSTYATYYIDLSAYKHYHNIRLGFRYTDSGVGEQGWAIDNVQVFVPAHNDLAFISLTPDDTLLSYATLNSAVTHTATVYNAGLDTVHSFTLSYRQGSGHTETATISGINIPPFTRYTFVHPIADTVTSLNASTVTAWVQLAGDTIHGNDSAYTSVRGAYFMPKKLLTVEGGECTLNFYSPKTWVYLNRLANDGPDANIISVHDGDTMAIASYSDSLYYLHYNSVPYMLIDRKRIPIDSVFSFMNVRKNYFGFAQVDADGGLNLNKDSVMVNMHIKPAIDLTGDMRLALVITQDNVTGRDTAFSQRNIWAGGLMGAMGGFENKADTVPSELMYYNFVARSVTPTPYGKKGLLPATLTSNTTYNYTLTAHLDPAWHGSKLKAYVLFLRNDDSTILNSGRLNWYLPVIEQNTATLDATIYPNPAYSLTHVEFNLFEKEKVTIIMNDLIGRNVWTQTALYPSGSNRVNIPIERLLPGIYLVTIAAESARKTFKVEVLH